jgi:hypothetical protein
MKFRKLRIAWSTVYGTVCLLLIALSARSFERSDVISMRTNSSEVTLGSNDCTLYAIRTLPLLLPAKLGVAAPTVTAGGWTHTSSKATATLKQDQFDLTPGRELIKVPNWLILIVGIAATGAPWLGSRFSLRTVLIATTLVAMVLGLVVYSASH